MATEFKILDDDIIRVRDPQTNKLIATLFWGDRVKVMGKVGADWLVELPRRIWDDAAEQYVWTTEDGIIKSGAEFRSEALLKLRFVDVGQGDAAMVETPEGAMMIIDGGEGEHLRRYVGAAFAHHTRNGPLKLDALVVTHGDADHFAGLTQLLEARRAGGNKMITADRVLHNGLVKNSGSGAKVFGNSKKIGTKTYITELHNDIRQVADSKMNDTFQAYKTALAGLRTRNNGRPHVRRLEYGDDAVFSFLDDDIEVEVLGPGTETISGASALRYYRSAGHTINGHSVVLRMRYGNVRVLFGADLNEESEEWMLERISADNRTIESEILKVPHHGSHEFSPRVLEAISPVVSIISSGDESGAKEYIHPRSGLVGALGKFSRSSLDAPLIYVTEMVAFFAKVGKADVRKYAKGAKNPPASGFTHPNVYLKSKFGIVHVRTDGTRVLVATHSGRDDRKEAYAFKVAADGSVTMEAAPRII